MIDNDDTDNDHEGTAPDKISPAVEQRNDVRASILEAVEEAEGNAPRGSDRSEDSEHVKHERHQQHEDLGDMPDWSKSLPREAQRSIAKREKEYKAGIVAYENKARQFDEWDAVVKPYSEEIKRFGVTPAQTVDRLFQWMKHISHPDPKHREQAFYNLAKSFDIDIGNKSVAHNPHAQPQQYQHQPRPQRQQFTPEENQRAQEVLKDFAATHPHFNRVRSRMGKLCADGIVPMIDSPATHGIDLETAYEIAVRLDKTLSGAALTRQATAAISAAKKHTQINKAKGNKPHSNGYGSHLSIRDSLQNALLSSQGRRQ